MLRRLIVAAALCLLAAAGPVYALGLGEIKVDSRLNQRFSAVIPFASLSKDEAGNVRARLADNSAFVRAGIERSGYVGTIQVEVVTAGGSPRIVLSSKEIAREPLLSLMIEASTPGGPRVLREYTVFLDPPTSVQTPAPTPKALPVPAASSDAQTVAPAARVGAAPESEFFQTPEETRGTTQSRPAASADPTRYGPVRPGDTLWIVAQAVKPSGVGLDQAMLALYENNPGAFVNGDIDNLRKGATLKVPSAESMKNLSNAAARARINELSSQISSTTPLPAASAASDSKPASVDVAQARSEPAAVRQVTAPAPAAVSEAASAEVPADALGSSETPAPADAVTPAAGEVAVSPAGEEAAATPAAAPVEAAAPAPVPDVAAPQKDWLQMLLPFLIGLILLLIGVAVFRAMRDRKAQQDYNEASRAAPSAPRKRAAVAAAAAAAAPAPAPVRSARAELEELDRKLESADEDATRVSAHAAETDDDQTRIEVETTGRYPLYAGGDVLAEPRQPDEAEIEVNSRIQANTTEIDLGDNDPMSEADFHLAYGLYDEAALMLQQASAKNPGRTELKVKLAETYFAAGKPREFEQTAAQLQGKVGADGWSKIAIMGRQLCPESVLFKDSDASPSDLSIDMPFDEDAAIAPVSVDKGLEFNIEELELPTQAAEAATPKADPGLEFDLGEFDLGDAAKPPAQSSGKAVDLKDFDLEDTQLTGGAPKGGLDMRLDDIEPLVLDDPMDSDTVGGHDEAGTKLDLARAYIEMGDAKMARSLLDEVEQSGTDDQKREASALRERLLS